MTTYLVRKFWVDLHLIFPDNVLGSAFDESFLGVCALFVCGGALDGQQWVEQHRVY